MNSHKSEQSFSPATSEENYLEIRHVLPVIFVTFLIGLYFVVRYNGLWVEGDTAFLTRSIDAIIRTGKLIPDKGAVYRNGYAYQAIGAVLQTITGVDPVSLQQLVLPLGIVMLAVPACLLFYEITGSRRVAVLGSILLFTQPEFLFIVLRGSHEKFGRLFMILALFLLFRSFNSRQNVRLFTAYIALFYLVVYGMLASNFLISFPFIVALLVGLISGVLLNRIPARSHSLVDSTTQRLALVTPITLILAFLVMFYFYPPVQSSLQALHSIFDQTRALLLGTESATNVYEAVLNSWIHPSIYALVNVPNLLILFGGLSIWIWQGWQWVFRKREPKSRATWLLWLLYGAFGLQAALSIVSDASGAFGNIQYRLFPTFSLLGVAMVTDSLGEWLVRLPRTRWNQIGMGIAVFFMAIVSLIKATNEATLVNTWPFYRTPELHALQWFDNSVQNRDIWAGFGTRLPETFMLFKAEGSTNQAYRNEYEGIPYLLISDLTRQQSARTRLPLPDTSRFHTIYDNGMTQLFYRRPITPYQR